MQDALNRLIGYWTGQGCLTVQPMNTEVGAGTLQPGDVPAGARSGAVAGGLRGAVGAAGRRALRREPQPHPDAHPAQVVLKPEPGDAQALYLDSLHALGVDMSAHDVRFVEDNWDSPAARRVGPGLGGLARRPGDHPVHLPPAGRRRGPGPAVGGDHLRRRADRDGAAGRASTSWTSRTRRASRTARCSARRRTRCPATTSTTRTCAANRRLLDTYADGGATARSTSDCRFPRTRTFSSARTRSTCWTRVARCPPPNALPSSPACADSPAGSRGCGSRGGPSWAIRSASSTAATADRYRTGRRGGERAGDVRVGARHRGDAAGRGPRRGESSCAGPARPARGDPARPR